MRCKTPCATSTTRSAASSRSCAVTRHRERSSRTTPSRCRRRTSSSSDSTNATAPSSFPRSAGLASADTDLSAATSARSPSAGRQASGSLASCGRRKDLTRRSRQTIQSASTEALRCSLRPPSANLSTPSTPSTAFVTSLRSCNRGSPARSSFSSNWHKLKGKISRLRMHEANVRKNFLHKETTKFANSHGVYRMEKLRVRNMTASAKGTIEEPGKNVAQKSGLNRSILDQGWGMFATFLSYKEQERGGRVEFTPAPYTSLRCPAPGCGHTHANNRPTRDWFCCEVCGYEGHADVVGAINVSQGRILPVEPPKRIRRRVGKRKPVEERVSHGA